MTYVFNVFQLEVIGISIPDMMVQSLTVTNPFSIGFFGILIPSLTGYFVAWYCIKNIKKNDDIASYHHLHRRPVRGRVYITTYSIPKPKMEDLDITLLPNLTFTIALSLCVIFRYKRA